MKARLNSRGIGHLALVFVLLFVAVVGFAGYKVMTKNSADSTVNSTAPTTLVPKKISNKASLTQAGKALDNSSSDVNSNLNDKALDPGLNDML